MQVFTPLDLEDQVMYQNRKYTTISITSTSAGRLITLEARQPSGTPVGILMVLEFNGKRKWVTNHIRQVSVTTSLMTHDVHNKYHVEESDITFLATA